MADPLGRLEGLQPTMVPIWGHRTPVMTKVLHVPQVCLVSHRATWGKPRAMGVRQLRMGPRDQSCKGHPAQVTLEVACNKKSSA